MVSFRSSIIVIVVAGAVYSGCAGEGRPPADQQFPPGTPASIEATPILSVGTVAGDTLQELYRVVTPFLDAGGRLVVPLASASTIRVFGPDGAFLTALGRSGEGPGEFVSLGAVWPRGDTIEAFDTELRRMTRFLPDGAVDVVNLDRTVAVQGVVPGAVPGGWILSRIAGRDEPKSPAAQASGRDDIVIHHFARDGSHVGEIARTLGIARYAVPGSSGLEPLSPRAVLYVNGGLLYVGETLTPQWRVLEPDGTVRMEVSWEPAASGPVAGAVGSVIDSAVARAPADQAERTRTWLEAAPVPDRLSIWWDYVVDSEGFLWIRPYEPVRHAAALGGLGTSSYLFVGSGRGGRWSIVSPDGATVKDIELPAELSPVQITTDALVGVQRDSLGVESVHVYRVVRH